MDIKEILELLKTDLLTEEQQAEVEQKIQDIIDLQVQDKLNEAIEKEKESLVEVYEAKYEEYKTDIISRFSDFTDTVLEKELVIPENIMEYARLGELYSDLITEFKSRIAVDEGTLDEEAKQLLAEARDEIQRLREELNEATNENLEMKKDSKELASELYKRTKCDGLTESQRKNAMRLLEGIHDKDSIDRKFEVIVKHYINEQDDEEEDSEDDGKTNECVCPECDKTYNVKGACNMNECDECGAKLKNANVSEGHAEVKDKKEVIVEKSPFDEYKKNVLKVLKENKF
jgi:hypothetical protein